MISMLLLAAIAAAAPVEARVTAVDLQKPVGAGAMAYNRISVELESIAGRQLRLCPSDVSVVTERRVGEGFARVDRVPAYAMRLGRDLGHSGSCREVALAPRRPRTVTFYVAGVPGRPFNGQDSNHRYTIVLNPGSSSAGRASEPAP